MTSARAKPGSDKAWNYVRESDTLTPFLHWIPRVGPNLNLYECCVRDGWPAKLTSNMPDGSYATKYLFEPHPTLPHAWKYVARLDDTVALVNGEKFSPVALESRIRSDPWVTEAVVFGAGRPYIGALLVASKLTAGKTNDQVLDHIWPVVEAGNRQSEAYGRLSRNMIVVLPPDTVYPATDKGSIIDKNDAEIQIDADFFGMGMDSLQAIRLRQEIVRHVDVGGHKLGSNVVFDHPSIGKLGAFLHRCQSGSSTNSNDINKKESTTVENEMRALIEKFSTFDDLPVLSQHNSASDDSRSTSLSSVVVTGTTGSLGAHVAAQLAQDSRISTIYCLVRAADEAHAKQRVKTSLADRCVLQSLTVDQRSKLRCLPFDQADQQLGLASEVYNELTSNKSHVRLRAVIHCAWSVNFNLHLSSFEQDCLAGVHNLLCLCKLAGGAVFSICSSVSTVARCPLAHVPETLPDLAWAQSMGYAQSKCVAEHVSARAADPKMLGVPTRFGIWNTTEAIPLMLQSALTVGALLTLNEQPSWLPVDTVATTVIDVSMVTTTTDTPSCIVTNIANPRCFDWTADLLPALHKAGLVFDEVTPKEWVRRLRASKPDPVANPPVKLVDFFASKYDRDDEGTEVTAVTSSKKYATEVACRRSPALVAAPVLDQAVVDKFIETFQQKWATTA